MARRLFLGRGARRHRHPRRPERRLDRIEKVTHQRNAQEIVSIGVCATMGGANFVVPGDKRATIENLITGTIGQTGLWKGKTFRLTSLNPETLPGALEYVKFDANLLLYEPAGGQ
jgi:hypothetical protein